MPLVQAFEISTTGELRKRFLAQMPEGTRLERAHVATLAADEEGWCAIDAPYFRRGEGIERIGSSFRTRDPLMVFVDQLVPPAGRTVIAAVEVRTSSEAPSSTRALEAGVAVDFRELMIARSAALQRCWRVGGPRCRANLLDLGDPVAMSDSTVGTLDVAARLLSEGGLRLTRSDPDIAAMRQALVAQGYPSSPDTAWYLERPVSDEQLEIANELLVRNGSKVIVNVARPHSCAQIEDALRVHVAAALTEADETFGIVLYPGFGNGSYGWVELLAGDRVVGHRMDFLGD